MAIGALTPVESPTAGASRQLAAQLTAIGEQQSTVVLLAVWG